MNYDQKARCTKRKDTWFFLEMPHIHILNTGDCLRIALCSDDDGVQKPIIVSVPLIHVITLHQGTRRSKLEFSPSHYLSYVI